MEGMDLIFFFGVEGVWDGIGRGGEGWRGRGGDGREGEGLLNFYLIFQKPGRRRVIQASFLYRS